MHNKKKAALKAAFFVMGDYNGINFKFFVTGLQGADNSVKQYRTVRVHRCHRFAQAGGTIVGLCEPA